MSPYLVITGDLTNSDHMTVRFSAPTKPEAEIQAKKLCEECPGIKTHIFSWETGYKSKPEVIVDRLWSNDYIVEAPPELEG